MFIRGDVYAAAAVRATPLPDKTRAITIAITHRTSVALAPTV